MTYGEQKWDHSDGEFQTPAYLAEMLKAAKHRTAALSHIERVRLTGKRLDDIAAEPVAVATARAMAINPNMLYVAGLKAIQIGHATLAHLQFRLAEVYEDAASRSLVQTAQHIVDQAPSETK